MPIPGGNNHVYGTFTAAKERMVGVGCALAGKSKLQPMLLLPMTVSMHPVGSVNVNEHSNKLVRRSECIGRYRDTWTVCPSVGLFCSTSYSTAY